MAAPTMTVKGKNRELHCTTVNFVMDSAQAASTYTSTGIVPAGASIIAVSAKVNGTGITGGTNLTVEVGGVSVSAAIVIASLSADNETTAEVAVSPATLDGGAIGITTTGSNMTAGDIDITVCYIV